MSFTVTAFFLLQSKVPYDAARVGVDVFAQIFSRAIFVLSSAPTPKL